MTASLKHALEPHRGFTHNSQSSLRQIRGINQLKSKMSALQEEYEKRLFQRQKDIASLIVTLDLADIDDQLLIGGLLFLKDKIMIQEPLVEGWRNAGDRFLRQAKKSKSLTPSKESATPHQIPQSSQKHPQSRAKQDEKATAI